jgi:NTE family protein
MLKRELLILGLLAGLAPGLAARPKLGLVLSGGGARGAAEIGVLKVLDAMRVPVDLVAGTSFGSLVGGMFCLGMSPQEIEEAFKSIDFASLYDDRARRADQPLWLKERDFDYLTGLKIGWKNGGVRIPSGHSEGRRVTAMLRRFSLRAGNVADFDALPIPFRAVAVDLASGRPVAQSRGDLAMAMRASMAVPGAFAPVYDQGQALVDGGVLENLPVEPAKAMGAQVLVVVDVSSPLKPLSSSAGLLEVAGRTIDVATVAGNRLQEALLGKHDLVLRPDLEGVDGSQFNHMAEAIQRGEDAAWAACDQLEAWSVPEADYEAWKRRVRRPGPTGMELEAVRVAAPGGMGRWLASRMETRTGRALDLAVLDRDLDRLMATGLYEDVPFYLRPVGGNWDLDLEPREKSWGPDYLYIGLELRSDSTGQTGFGLRLGADLTRCNAWGGVWRQDALVGQENSYRTEWHQPLWDGPVFAAVKAEGREWTRLVYRDGDAEDDYLCSTLGAGLDLGLSAGSLGELRLGWWHAREWGRRSIGTDGPPDYQADIVGPSVLWQVDTLDAPAFPKSGLLLRSRYLDVRPQWGGSADWRLLEFSRDQVFDLGPLCLRLGVEGKGSLDRSAPQYAQPSLGGFLHLTGHPPGSIVADDLALARLLFIGPFTTMPPGTGDKVYAGLSLEAAQGWDTLGQPSAKGPWSSAALLVGFDSVLGSLYVSYGYSPDRPGGMAYLLLGNPF